MFRQAIDRAAYSGKSLLVTIVASLGASIFAEATHANIFVNAAIGVAAGGIASHMMKRQRAETGHE